MTNVVVRTVSAVFVKETEVVMRNRDASKDITDFLVLISVRQRVMITLVIEIWDCVRSVLNYPRIKAHCAERQVKLLHSCGHILCRGWKTFAEYIWLLD